MPVCIDLTRPLNAATPLYVGADYRDPPLEVEHWCSVAEQGFRVSRLALGTQTGTHIDAPAHFVEGAATLEALPVEALLGPYLLLDVGELCNATRLAGVLSRFGGEPLLLLVSRADATPVPESALRALLALGCRVWVLMGTVEVSGREPLFFHRLLAEAGVYLVEDLDERQVERLVPGGELIALPLRLEGVSGSPCRVLLRL